LTNKWTDWIDYWSVDFDYESKPEVLRIQKDCGEISEVKTGNFIFENEWQSFRTKESGSIELESSIYRLDTERSRQVAVKVVDIFGNDTIKVLNYQGS
jgi:site-specific DNA-methyltransferase (adenine-specific)/adenine-specific DNA-methyltransferase